METIGSRLRKRRRTSPMFNEDSGDSSPPSKRAQPTRGASTRGKRGQAVTAQESGVPASAHAEAEDSAYGAPSEPRNSPPLASSALPEESPTANHQLATEQHHPPSEHPLDINNVIADIINHGETVENHCASQGYAAMGMVDTESYSQLGASLHLKLQSLPILDNLVNSG